MDQEMEGTPVRREVDALTRQLESSPFFAAVFSPTFTACLEVAARDIPEPCVGLPTELLDAAAHELPQERGPSGPSVQHGKGVESELGRLCHQVGEHTEIYLQYIEVVQVLAQEMKVLSEAARSALHGDAEDGVTDDLNDHSVPRPGEGPMDVDAGRAALREWQHVMATADHCTAELLRLRAIQKQKWGGFWRPKVPPT